MATPREGDARNAGAMFVLQANRDGLAKGWVGHMSVIDAS